MTRQQLIKYMLTFINNKTDLKMRYTISKILKKIGVELQQTQNGAICKIEEISDELLQEIYNIIENIK